MGALESFLSTWTAARETFGHGTPDNGAQIDKSNQLRQMQGQVESAAPGSRWTGSGSDSYGAANTRHARTFGELAGLDQKLATEVGNSAAVVSAGRRDLDDVRQRVLDAAAAVPNTKDREKLLWPIVGKGSGEIADVIRRSHGDLTAIAGRISGIGGEYQAVGNDIKLGVGDGKDPNDPKDPADKLHGALSPEETQRAADI